MVSLLTSPSINHTWLPNASTQLGLYRSGQFRRNTFIVRSENVPSTSTSSCEDRPGRRQLLAMGTTLAPWLFFSQQTPTTFAAETKKGFLSVTDKKDGYTFVYPFGWQHDVDGKAYYTIEFIAQAPNYTRHALSAVCIGNGKFYTLTTGANERRWEKMKDRLKTVVDSFQIFNV
ncbi:UNVERIFIED_CONTAM: PsbP-like protein 1, chloroplastic [Sesamum radiatum]|uniref:PsbP-like protein 1, chloroplastic n=1 Tax=Sesamum radiatum TaxID=300843 RepID=A0AAW2PGB0_SESRA